jgi:3-hydroxyacyl-CoA dehydrogenase
MDQAVSTEILDEVAVIRIDNPPVNALSNDVIAGLRAEVAKAAADPAARAIVMVGAGRTFVAGADIKGLEGMAWGDMSGAPDMHDTFAAIEDCPKPVVMAMHGTALGGGLELAMSGHYRVATRDARLGQPEVNLGIIPGAEGTQRLPRLVGVEKALEMCVSGRPITAEDALRAGLIEWVVEGDLVAGAVSLAREKADLPGRPPRTRERTDKLPSASALPAMLEAGRALAAKTKRHLEAPRAVVDAIAAAATLPFEQGCRRERELFFECARSEQAKALIYAFFAERTVAKVPGLPAEPPAAAKSVAIVGAGTMGNGIAMACANAGLDVVLTDTDQARVDNGVATIAKNYDSSVSRGRMTADDVRARMSRITAQPGAASFKDADVVIEAAFENMAVKQEIFRRLDAGTKPGCILATNTSTLDIDAIASATSRPAAVVGLHFFSPANVMRLVEIVRGRETAPATVAAALALARKLGKVGVVVANGFGFVGNRLMLPYMYEAQFLAEEGATPQQVDKVLTDFGMAMGIFAVDDMAGLDVAWRVRQEHPAFPAGMRQPLVADVLCEMGRFGQKTGAGWFRYASDRKAEPDPEIEALIERRAREAGITRRAIGDDEIRDRLLLTLVNGGARVLDEGIALRASDIDVIYLTGYGFPAFRGGPMFYADRRGLADVHARVAEFHRQHGPRWQPAPLLERLAREGSTFRQLDAGRTS